MYENKKMCGTRFSSRLQAGHSTKYKNHKSVQTLKMLNVRDYRNARQCGARWKDPDSANRACIEQPRKSCSASIVTETRARFTLVFFSCVYSSFDVAQTLHVKWPTSARAIHELMRNCGIDFQDLPVHSSTKRISRKELSRTCSVLQSQPIFS